MGYDKTNRGGIWVNTNKKTENHPDYKGSLNVGGKDYWISCWKKKNNENDKAPVLTFAVDEKQEKRDTGYRKAALDYVHDSDIPF